MTRTASRESKIVVPLKEKGTQPSHGTSPLRQYVGEFTDQVHRRLQTVFDRVDDALFDMAEKADNNAAQSEFFDGMREIRKQRGRAERSFREALEEGLSRFARNEPLTAPAELPDDSVVERTTPLRLIEDADLEQSLAIANMTAKGENRFSRPLFALNHRLGALLKQAPPDDEQNPLGPAFLCQCFRRATLSLGVETRVMILIYKLFDKELISQLGDLYERLSERLATAGVLPQLPQHVARATRALSHAQNPPDSNPEPTTHREPTVAPTAPPSLEPNEAIPLHLQMFNTIRNLLASRRAAPNVDATEQTPGSGEVAAQSATTLDLVNALTLLQTDQTTTASVGAFGFDTRAVKKAVIDQVQRLGGDGRNEVHHDDEDTIDLVGMLFEFILQDRNLPDAMQALLSRLQIPYVKVALLDRALFAQKSHPARSLLDQLAEVCVGWSEDRDDRLYQKVAELVARVIEEFDDDLNFFEELLQDLNDFTAKRKRRATAAEKRTTEATKGRERLQAARKLAAQQIKLKLQDQPLPPLIDEILRKPWANALVITLLRHGQSSEQWALNLKVVDDLVWSGRSKTTAADVARLQSMLPHLAKQMRIGLEMVAYTAHDIKKVFGDLKTLYQSMIDRQYREQLTIPSGTATATPTTAALSLPMLGDTNHEDILAAAEALDNEHQTDTDTEPGFVHQIRQLEAGTWVEFLASDGQQVRAKLSWKSPITGNFLFVDQKGIKVADKGSNELAEEIKRGEAVILESVPLFERAMGAIASRLRDGVSEDPPPSTQDNAASANAELE